MTLLLDTHVFLWWVNGEPIPSRAADLLSAREHDILFSAARAWEMTIKASIDKLALPEPVVGFVQKNLALNGFRWIGIEPAALSVLQDLKFHHRDRFDRLLISQAIALGCPLLSADPYSAPIRSNAFGNDRQSVNPCDTRHDGIDAPAGATCSWWSQGSPVEPVASCPCHPAPSSPTAWRPWSTQAKVKALVALDRGNRQDPVGSATRRASSSRSDATRWQCAES